MLYLKIKFSNGECYKVPAKDIALQRALYYACTIDGYKENSKEFWEEFDFSMNRSELKDWISNNMDWEDIYPISILMDDQTEFNYDEDFINADISFIEDKHG